MKQILVLLIASGIMNLAQGQQRLKSPFTEDWKKVDLFLSKELPESALQAVKIIRDRAEKSGYADEELKAIYYIGIISQSFQENAWKQQIESLDQGIGKAKGPARSLLQSMLGNTLWKYLEENRWRLYGRESAMSTEKDIDTWSAEQIQKAIEKNLTASLENADMLQQVKTGDWQAIITKGNQKTWHATLYDLLSMAALDYFTRGEYELSRFSGSFELDDTAAFSPAAVFARHKFRMADSVSLKARAIEIFQSLLRNHLSDKDPEALVRIDLQRLRFVYENSTIPDKQRLFTVSLASLEKQFAHIPAAAEVAYHRLQHLRTLAENHSSKQDPLYDRNALQAIASACRQLENRYPGTEGAQRAKQLLKDLEQKSLSAMIEKVNTPGQPFRCRIDFKNIPSIHYRIITLTDSQYQRMGFRMNKNDWDQMTRHKPLRQIRLPLPDPGDLRPHAVEIPIEALPNGRYMMLASSDPDFASLHHPLTSVIFHVSNIGWIIRESDGFVLDRVTGRPLHDAEVKAWKTHYDYQQETMKLVDPAILRTDLDGYFRMPGPGENDRMPRRLEVSWKQDRLMLESSEAMGYPYNRNQTEDRVEYEFQHSKLYLFTDRKIYRPGQSIYFKGLMVTRDFDTKQPKIITDYRNVVKLMDPQGEIKDSMELVTGAFGSFSGILRIPSNMLTGSFSIEGQFGHSTIQVEDYKRPSFYIEWEEGREAHRLYDTIYLRGKARSMAGSPLNGATVRYRITRHTHFPHPWHLQNTGWGFPPLKPYQIGHGETTTGIDGSFIIAYKAEPDKATDPAMLPVFDFEAEADITDLGGETQSTTNLLPIGYHSLSLNLQKPEGRLHPNDSNLIVHVTATNLSGNLQKTVSTLQLHPLKGPDRFLRERYWGPTDTTLISEEAYRNLFPFDPYLDEDNRNTWPIQPAVFIWKDSIRQIHQLIEIPAKKMKPGWYRLVLSATDDHGQAISTQEDLLIMDATTGETTPTDIFSTTLSQPSAVPGEKPVLTLSSTVKDLWLIELLDGYEMTLSDRSTKIRDPKTHQASMEASKKHPFRCMTLPNGFLKVDLPITETHRGGFGIEHVFVRHNRFHHLQQTLSVPWSQKDLAIQFTSWRDKTNPGSQETWSVKVVGNQREKMVSELLMSMYDASLDQLVPFDWERPSLFENYPYRNGQYRLHHWQFRNGFSGTTGLNRPQLKTDIRIPERIQDALIWITDDAKQRVYAAQNARLKTSMQVRGRPEAMAAPPTVGYADADTVLTETIAAVRKPVNKTTFQTYRKDFRETAFFFPDLKSDSSGDLSFSFTMPEALTEWKWQVLAHSRDLATGLSVKKIITQKELMVQPNTPRFLREGDRISLPVRITNMSDSEMTGLARLELYDSESGYSVDGYFHNVFPRQYFTAPAGQTTVIHFTIQVPADFSRPVGYRISAETKTHQDGEEKIIPVVSNRMFITESLPLRMQGAGTRDFVFRKLLASGSSSTLTHHRLTLEYAANPIWQVVNSLPYLAAYPYECVEQSFNRFYAHALASQLRSQEGSKIKLWLEKNLGGDLGPGKGQFASELNKNPELKGILLEETPWVLDARDEETQRRNLAALFDEKLNASNLTSSLEKLRQAQLDNGSFSWFPGGTADRFMTQYIISGMGQLAGTGGIPAAYTAAISKMAEAGLRYILQELVKDHVAAKQSGIQKQSISSLQVQALYALSCFPSLAMQKNEREACAYFTGLTARQWMRLPLQVQGMAAMMLHRTTKGQAAADIIRSLKQRAIVDTATGMYWKAERQGWNTFESAVERQSVLIEAFLEIARDSVSADKMKAWLLSRKQSGRWESTKATAEACRALMLTGSKWLRSDKQAEIRIGSEQANTFRSYDADGQIFTVIPGEKMLPEMGNIKLKIEATKASSKQEVSWGAIHWQYFEHLDKVAPAAGPLKVEKKIYRETMTTSGPQLQEWMEDMSMKVGDRLRIRIILSSDRDLDYIHLKDMRAAGTEPAEVLSGYRWQSGLGFYQSTRDAATNFFISYLPKGTHIFEYMLMASHEGRYAAGLASAESMYAPEFRTHSANINLRIDGN